MVFVIVHLTFSECPELGLPEMDPYEFLDPFILQKMQFTSLLTKEIYWSNMKAFGINKIIVQQYR